MVLVKIAIIEVAADKSEMICYHSDEKTVSTTNMLNMQLLNNNLK